MGRRANMRYSYERWQDDWHPRGDGGEPEVLLACRKFEWIMYIIFEYVNLSPGSFRVPRELCSLGEKKRRWEMARVQFTHTSEI